MDPRGGRCRPRQAHHRHPGRVATSTVPGHQLRAPRRYRRAGIRDYLRHGTARAYEQLKRELADRHRNDREAYTLGKTNFVRKVLARASSE
ncbi:MAG: GrpB family protein [Micrococcales bacterium]|nr:GrpB family protein [Micrococcales bacterium]